MKITSNFVFLVPVAFIALLSLKFTVLADSSDFDCLDETDDLVCARNVMIKCIQFGNSYSSKCNALCTVALSKLNGNWEQVKRARRKQSKTMSNTRAMQLLPMRKRDVEGDSDTRDTRLANPLFKRDAENTANGHYDNIRNVRAPAVDNFDDACEAVLSQFASTVVAENLQ